MIYQEINLPIWAQLLIFNHEENITIKNRGKK